MTAANTPITAAPTATSNAAAPDAAMKLSPTPDVAKESNRLTAAELLVRGEQLLDYLGDFLNPILVKEARQAMKSRQFSITFSLLLFLGWIWTIGFITYYNFSLYYQSYGVPALSVYYVVLTIPLLLVIPFATFRSLAAETEDGTFELLSITTLSARQIVLGKLASAALQMVVYYSALAPCIAFTYLLRGIDIITIGLLLVHTFLGSILLSTIGLAAATLSRSRMWQILASVLLIMGLLLATYIGIVMAMMTLFAGNGTLPYDEWWFWGMNGAAVSFVVAFSVLFVFVAAAQITFASENRSTPIRWVLLAIHLLIIGWMVYLWRVVPDPSGHFALTMMEFFAATFWMIAGAVLTGETAELSPRAKRNLPQSLLGRSLLTWFNPGSGSGYTFAVLNMAGVVLIHVMVVAVAQVLHDNNAPQDWDWFFVAISLLGYLAGYLGVVRLFVVLVRRYVRVEMLMVFLLHVAVLLAGVFVPLAILSLRYGMGAYDWEYSPLQLTNWWWTLGELTRSGAAAPWRDFISPSIFLIGLMIFLINLLETSEEVEKVRTVAPQRVLEDDAAQRPSPAHQPKNPWDVPAAPDGSPAEVKD